MDKGKSERVFNAQHQHWVKTYEEPDFFGEEPSYAAQEATKILKREGKTRILELGGGQGRDAFFFAQHGFQVCTVDYCESGVEAITRKAQKLGLAHLITAVCHDVRKPLPFSDETFDGCYSHMLFCMAFTTSELSFLSQEACRVLKKDGINLYTARNTKDKHFGAGIHRGEDLYEVNGFIVHFFSMKKIEHLSKGYKIEKVEEFEEGELPRKLYLVILRKLKKG